MFTTPLNKAVGKLLNERKLTLSSAESCTGGLLANLITDVPGSSIYFLGGIVAYSNMAKMEILGVPEKVIQESGVVSRSCAVEMAKGIKKVCRTDIGVGITGIAGPNGGTLQTPVGTVFIAITDGEKSICKLFKLEGGRLQIKQKAVQNALKMLKEFILSRDEK